MAKQQPPKSVSHLRHDQAKRPNIPTAEHQSLMRPEDQSPIQTAFERRNKDLDPQLVWRGKDTQDWSDLVVNAPPLYIQEKVHPKVLIDDLIRQSKKTAPPEPQADLFGDFNGLPSEDARTEFYKHDQHWTNRMILGDSLQVMASLAEREGLRGKVQCIYLDPPYGIKFNSNFQWSTTSRDVKDGNTGHITREPEQVKAFRDTWRDGIHSYLTYLRDRLTVARDLLTESGSIFVQIGDENVHRVRALMDEVFGDENFVSLITTKKSGGMSQDVINNISDFVLWYSKDLERLKSRPAFIEKVLSEGAGARYNQVEESSLLTRPITQSEKISPQLLPKDARVFLGGPLTSQTPSNTTVFLLDYNGRKYHPKNRGWSTNIDGMERLKLAGRLFQTKDFVNYKIYVSDFPVVNMSNLWDDTMGTADQDKVYVVQTASKVLQRCILMATDPGDLVLDPTCGSGTTAYVAEQWGRRWITVDTSRVALALARARIMGARYPYYLLADSKDGQMKEGEVTQSIPSSKPVFGDIRQGFVYERVPHITLKSIANNTEIDVIWETWQQTLEPLRESINRLLAQRWEEWEIPREARDSWPEAAKNAHSRWWEARIARQKEIDASIAAKAEFEYLYDKPYEDKKRVRVAGPFTVESMSPHRILGVDENDELIGAVSDATGGYADQTSFVDMVLDNLAVSGIQQAHKADRIELVGRPAPWPGGQYICAEARYREGDTEKRAGVFVGPEFGSVSRADLVAAAREAGDAGFDALISCAFNYDAHSTEFSKLGALTVLKARMNADLHMADDLKNTGKGNLFVIFGEPDIDIRTLADGQLEVQINGVDVFDPSSGDVRSDDTDGIACWFIDTDYNEESFFVRHAYFLGAGDPYKSLKTTLKAEIDPDAWATLNSAVSRPFQKPASGRIAIKVINHLGDEVMKVVKV